MNRPFSFRWYLHKLWVAALGFALGIVAFAIFAVACIINLQPAHADTNEDEYLIVLHQDGVHLDSTDMEVQLAHAVCSDLEGGAQMIPESVHVAAIWTHPILTLHQATVLVGAAGAALCPDKDPYVDTPPSNTLSDKSHW